MRTFHGAKQEEAVSCHRFAAEFYFYGIDGVVSLKRICRAKERFIETDICSEYSIIKLLKYFDSRHYVHVEGER